MAVPEKTGLAFGRREMRGRVTASFERKMLDTRTGRFAFEVNAGNTLHRRFSAATALATGATGTIGSYTVPTLRDETVTHLLAGVWQTAAFIAAQGFVVRLDDNGTILREFVLVPPQAATGLTTFGAELRGQSQHEVIARLLAGATINVTAVNTGTGAVTANVAVNWAGQALAFYNGVTGP